METYMVEKYGKFSFPSLSGLFQSREKKKAQKRVESHFSGKAENKWDNFDKNVARKSFVRTLGSDSRSDKKLLLHADNMNRMKTGKVVGKVRGNPGGRTSGRDGRQTYQISKLRGSERIGCTCNDWKFRKSVAGPGQEQDCRHIKEWRAAEQSGNKLAGMAFTKQDRPEKVKDIYKALKRDHPEMPAEMKARIAARQGKPGKQKQGPPYKGPIKEAAKSLGGGLLTAAGIPRAGAAYNRALNTIAPKIERALKYEIPGTQNIRVLPKKKAHRLAKVLSHPERGAVIALPGSPVTLPAYEVARRKLPNAPVAYMNRVPIKGFSTPGRKAPRPPLTRAAG
jgi:hypothetical protein